MKKSSRYIKTTKIIFRTVAIIALVVGLAFSYLIAQLEDAPGVVIIGIAITLVASALVYGIGEIIVLLKNK